VARPAHEAALENGNALMENDTTRRYWQSLDERDANEAFLCASAEGFPEPRVPDAVGVGTLGRRSFLKAAGFGLAAMAAGCARAPVEKAIPFLINR
jgi:molybdopterin-containing oxidoreductase family iron-sulfur binding subunit